MSELIEREAVREFIKSYSHSTDVVYHMEKHLYEVPTIDAVEVVRCGECKFNYANMIHDPLDDADYTDITCTYWMSDGVHPKDYCSKGARMDGERRES